MSFVFAPNEVFQDPRLSKPELRTLFGLFSFRDSKTDFVLPSVKSLAERVGMTEPEILASLLVLSELDWIVDEKVQIPETMRVEL